MRTLAQHGMSTAPVTGGVLMLDTGVPVDPDATPRIRPPATTS
jgi:hypothetical protein